MKIARKALLPIVAALALHGCGGGDPQASSSLVTGTVAPTPTTPPPTTPVTPAITYELASDFARDRSFNAIGLRVFTTSTATGGVTILDSRNDAESAAIGFDFAAATRTYRARYNSDLITAPTQAKTYPIGGYGYDQFDSANSSFTRSASVIGTSYVGYVDWFDSVGTSASDPANRQTRRFLLFGARTRSDDLPTTGSRTLTGFTSTYGAAGTSEGRAASIAIDYATRIVSVTAAYQPQATGNAGSGINPIPATPVTMSGILDPATGRISGTATFGSAAPAGTFEGALYGPGAAEAGIVFKVTGPNGALYYGYIVARA